MNAAFREELSNLRHELHGCAELSGREHRTAAIVTSFLQGLEPDELITGLGGEGVAAVFSGRTPGPRILLRAELDALPIDETIGIAHASSTPQVAHKCGHDGHMAALCGVAKTATARRFGGAVLLLFQPAEETGLGARAVLEDPRFSRLEPDWVFALHNLPRVPLGRVVGRSGTFALASCGLTLKFGGETSHAAHPERGLDPNAALREILEELERQRVPTPSGGFALRTVTHARLGTPGFGIAPGDAEVQITLRAERDEELARLRHDTEDLGRGAAERHGLAFASTTRDAFPATANTPAAAELMRRAAEEAGLEYEEAADPVRWSEDFGYFTQRTPGALVCLGSGVEQPELHRPDYDWPDELTPVAVGLWQALIRGVLTE